MSSAKFIGRSNHDKKDLLPSEVVKAMAGCPPASQLVSWAEGGQKFPVTLASGPMM